MSTLCSKCRALKSVNLNTGKCAVCGTVQRPFNFDTGEHVILINTGPDGRTTLIKGQIVAGPCVDGCDGLFGWTNESTGEVDYVGMMFSTETYVRDESFDGAEVGTLIGVRAPGGRCVVGHVYAGPLTERLATAAKRTKRGDVALFLTSTRYVMMFRGADRLH